MKVLEKKAILFSKDPRMTPAHVRAVQLYMRAGLPPDDCLGLVEFETRARFASANYHQPGHKLMIIADAARF